MHILSSRIAAKDPIDDFEINADTGFECMSECQECDIKNVSGLSKELISRYMKGETTDADILREHESERRSAVREGKDKIYMIGDRCFGTDKESFISALRGNEVEKRPRSQSSSVQRSYAYWHPMIKYPISFPNCGQSIAMNCSHRSLLQQWYPPFWKSILSSRLHRWSLKLSVWKGLRI